MYDPNRSAPPFNPVPPVVWGIVGVIAAFEIVFQMAGRGLIGGPGGIGWRLEAVRTLGFHQLMWEYIVTTGAWPVQAYWSFVSYGLVHAGFTHALFACVLILALGNMTARIFHPIALILVMLAAEVAGAVAYGILGGEGTLFGAYPAIYGMLGLYTWSLWAMADRLGQNPYRAFQLVAVLLGVQVIFILIGGRWDSLFAEVSGFVAGFVLAAPAAPGGLARLRARLQGR